MLFQTHSCANWRFISCS